MREVLLSYGEIKEMGRFIPPNKIVISKYAWPALDRSERNYLIAHEMAHFFNYQETGSLDHDEEWRKWMKRILAAKAYRV